ncbi:pH-response regulator protein palF/RIM8 [Tolypocladium paradoxum]|uniref:pH-response regulator protein palF/RIM8 n=1 Tax=Tolypocladium paradoxum TaxID=94208 RepID=A0A2S4KVW3_9HYPO|nr:pH-response regulator protein palF/RIM8 [Tolypocladium paradoxum]
MAPFRQARVARGDEVSETRHDADRDYVQPPFSPRQGVINIGRVSTSSSPSLPSPAPAAASSADAASELPALPLQVVSTSSRPGLLSRLNLPLSRPLCGLSRHVVDFHVRCDEPDKTYSAEDSVRGRGAVALTLVKPLCITRLVVSLHGYVHVTNDSTSVTMAKGAATVPQGGSSGRPQYHGNGFATLFQDKQVLNSEGRLEPGNDLTRPTSIAPTMSCNRKVKLAERIDIGLLPTPWPRTISLEPNRRRKWKKKPMELHKTSLEVPSDNEDLASEADSLDRPVTGDSDHDNPPDHRSAMERDTRREIGGRGEGNSRTAINRTKLAQSAQVGSRLSTVANHCVGVDRTLTATIELLRGGHLPGEMVSIRVTLKHMKIKRLIGVVVTLFREGKTDTLPPPSMFTNIMTKEDARKAQKEFVHSKSLMGLGRLSLSSRNSTSIFQNIDQTTAPLIIDQAALQSSVTVSVKVPDDAFPTIKGVLGEMISFRYQVEVLVDFGGGFIHQTRGQPSRSGSYGTSSLDERTKSYGTWRGAKIPDTAQLREKDVISIRMETVVGTMDSSRG